MQILSGRYRGRKFAVPAGARPTQNMARTAVFNILTPLAPFETAWDAFAGSGILGAECISRDWVKLCLFSDIESETVCDNVRGMPGANVMNRDALKMIQSMAPGTGLVFVDPPYDQPQLGQKFVDEFNENASDGAVVVWEMENSFVPKIPDMTVVADKAYGRARFLILQKK